MDLLDALVNEPGIALSMAFRAGDLQFLHNHQILHSRNDFVNWPEPARHRHLLRLWLAPEAARPPSSSAGTAARRRRSRWKTSRGERIASPTIAARWCW